MYQKVFNISRGQTIRDSPPALGVEREAMSSSFEDVATKCYTNLESERILRNGASRGMLVYHGHEI
jgi:hypothetical protein